MRIPVTDGAATFARLDLLEAQWCARCSGLALIPAVRRFFSVVSRLGDGIAWYLLIIGLPVLFGLPMVPVALHMTVVALAGLLLYRVLKEHLVRERPFAAGRNVHAVIVPLDRYSFPSGHTLHAASFTIMVAQCIPELLPVILPFALSIAASRVVLGLHYPSDVLAGALLGAGVAWTGSVVLPF